MNEIRIRAAAAASLVLLTLGGCLPYVGKPEVRDVDLTLPDRFGDSQETANSAELTVQGYFQDPFLVALVDQALSNNQELNIVELEVAIANNEVTARYGEILPKVGVGAGAGIEKVGEFTSQGASDAADEIEPGKTVPENLQNYRLGFLASWEVDIWNKLRNATKAAVFRTLSSREALNFLVTRLVAEIADSYYELLALDSQLQALERNIQILNDALSVVRIQKERGRVTELAVQRFEAEVFRNRSRVFDIRQRIVQTENRINLLVGRYPQAVERRPEGFLNLDPLPVHTGLPAQLLANRPDVKKAELDLEAFKLDVEVAKAEFYPSLSIEASLGLESYKTTKLFYSPESIFYGAFAGLSAPLLNRNALTAGYYTASAKQMQAVYNFERILRTAYTEAANQIARISNLGQKYELKARQAEILTGAIDSSNKLFASARADYMEVLLTRRDALESQMELIETKREQLGAMVNVYQALGGGWREPPTEEANESTTPSGEPAGSDPESDSEEGN